MSTVLTKPVLLDETGQAIVGKLDDIKEAIGTGGEYIPIKISVTTPPTKTTYFEGETLDLSGLVVSLIATNGSAIDITSECVFSPSNGTILTTLNTNVSISYHYIRDDITFNATLPITVNEILPTQITVTTPPTKTEYIVGETIDLTGMVITASYTNGTTADVTSSCTYVPANGTTLADDTVTAIAIEYVESGITVTASQSITVIFPIYGVEWDGSATINWTRTDLAADFTDPSPAINNGDGSSPFDNILPWSGMQRIEDPTAGTLVSIPKFYYKWTRTGNAMKLQISNSPFEGALVSPAHSDRGDGQGERDVVYVGAYHCASTYKSTTGVTPALEKTRATCRTSIHNLGSDLWQYDFAMYWTICMLYLVEYADWNSQAAIGYGCSSSNYTWVNNGFCDNMIYHTGTSASNRTTYGHVRYRYIEDLWANVFDWCDGIYFDSSGKAYCIKNPNNFSDGSYGTLIGQAPAESGWIQHWTEPTAAGFEFALCPTAPIGTGSSSTYITDYIVRPTSETRLLNIGGSFNDRSEYYGLFYFDASRAVGYKFTSVGCRLMKLPANT